MNNKRHLTKNYPTNYFIIKFAHYF